MVSGLSLLWKLSLRALGFGPLPYPTDGDEIVHLIPFCVSTTLYILDIVDKA